MLDTLERAEQQQENQEEADRHPDAQALLGGDKVLILTAPIKPSTGGQWHLRDFGLRLGHERTKVAPAHVALDHNAAFTILAADLIDAFGDLDLRHRTKRDES